MSIQDQLELYSHQKQSVEFKTNNQRVFDTSDPGTGKTRTSLEAFKQRLNEKKGRMLVICPKTIMQASWGEDIQKFTPDLTVSFAYANNRQKAFEANTDIVVMNHDGVKWIIGHPEVLNGFTSLIVDESTAFKHRTSQRSAAIAKIAAKFEYRELLTGTPISNSVTDIWHQVFLLDRGERLGKSFWKFRSAVCTPIQVGPNTNMIQWHDKPGAEEAVAELLSDITIRHKFEECIDIPENVERVVKFDLSPAHMAAYEVLQADALLKLSDEKEISAPHAGVLATKLLQMASGASYDLERAIHVFDTMRYELVADLVEERKQCVVAYNWHHQLNELGKELKKRGITYGVIGGGVNPNMIKDTVDSFQRGHLRVILAHPASAAHGLTLTAGTSTIWASPTYNSEQYIQFNRRIYRAGQKQKTETIQVIAKNTIDERVVEKLSKKLVSMTDLLIAMKTETYDVGGSH